MLELPKKPINPNDLPPDHPPIATDTGSQISIQWLGYSCFYIHSPGGIAVVTDPFDPAAAGLPAPDTGAHLVTVSSQSPRHGYVQAVHAFQGDTKEVIRGTEARRGDTHVIPVPTAGGEAGANTAYVVEAGALRIAHLGGITQVLTPAEVKALGAVDILLLPVGEKGLSPKAAVEITRQVQPRIVIPMAYATPDMDRAATHLRTIDAFVAAGPYARTAQDSDVIMLSKAELPPSTEIYTLKYGH